MVKKTRGVNGHLKKKLLITSFFLLAILLIGCAFSSPIKKSTETQSKEQIGNQIDQPDENGLKKTLLEKQRELRKKYPNYLSNETELRKMQDEFWNFVHHDILNGER